MPKTKNPKALEYYAYTFAANGKVFFVGFGRECNASDRGRNVKRHMHKEARGEKPKWALNERVIRMLRFDHGLDIWIGYPLEKVTQSEARESAAQIMSDLLERRCVLANVRGNSKARIAEEVIQYILSPNLSHSHVGGRQEKLDC